MTDSNLRLGRRRFVQTAGLVATLGGFAGVGSASGDGQRYNVSFNRDTSRSQAETALDAQLGADSYEITDHIERLDITEITVTTGDPVSETVAIIELHNRVEYAEEVVEPAIPDEPSGPTIEAADLDTADYGGDPNISYGVDLIGCPTAWETTLGSNDTTVAVIDSKVQWTHPDLRDRFETEKGSGYTDQDPAAVDFGGHGTHVAGCAAATTDNGTGIAGTSNARLLGYSLFGGQSVARDIADAVEDGADVINMSFGYPRFYENAEGELVWSEGPQAVKDAIDDAVDSGVVVLASSGNYRGDPGLPDGAAYPAKWDSVVAVGATNSRDTVAPYSNEDVDVVSPGSRILSTVPTDRYREYTGTSMASPIAAGVAALILDADPELTPAEVEQVLKETAVDISEPERLQGAGRIDAAAAVEQVAADSGGPDASARLGKSVYDAPVGDTVEFTVELTNTDTATVQVGDADEVGYYVAGEVTDTDGDGSVTVAFDSAAAGTDKQVLSAPESGGEVSKVTQGGGFDGSDSLDAVGYPLRVRAGEKTGDSLAQSDADEVGTLSLKEREQTPYNGPHELPGRVQAEDFDTGGQGVAYNDTSGGNDGGAYRDTDVDIDEATEGGYFVGWIEAGEWWEYTVEVTEAGTYPVEALVASDIGGGSFTVEADGNSVSTSFDDTGGWQSWTTVSVGELELEAGETVVRITSDERLWNLNWFEFVDDSDSVDSSADIESGVYELHNVETNRVVDVGGQSTDDGANVIQWTSWGGENQRFRVSSDGGAYTLTAQHSGKYLAASDGNVVQEGSGDPTDSQRWTFESVDSGYVLENVGNGEVMTVEEPGDRWGGNIGTAADDGSDTQKWELVAV